MSASTKLMRTVFQAGNKDITIYNAMKRYFWSTRYLNAICQICFNTGKIVHPIMLRENEIYPFSSLRCNIFQNLMTCYMELRHMQRVRYNNPKPVGCTEFFLIGITDLKSFAFQSYQKTMDGLIRRSITACTCLAESAFPANAKISRGNSVVKLIVIQESSDIFNFLLLLFFLAFLIHVYGKRD